MAVSKVVLTADEAETFLAKVFEILDSYDFDRFPEVFTSNLEYQGGLEKSASLEDFTNSLRKALQFMPSMKTSHLRWKNDITSDGVIYSHGSSTADFEQGSVTIPMLGVYILAEEGPDKGKIKYMALYKDRVPILAVAKKSLGMGNDSR